MPLLSLIALAAMVFVSTDIDDLLLLILLFSDRRLSHRQVILGQFLGFLAIVVASLACSLLAILIPPAWLGLMGIWPLSIGLHRLFRRTPADVIGATAQAARPSLGIPTVALLTLANGGDNLTIYTPFFATLTPTQLALVILEFLLLLTLWCLAARSLTTHPLTRRLIHRIAHAILPYVLIALGFWILLRSLPALLHAA